MSKSSLSKAYVLEPGEKVAPVALYLANTWLVGEIVVKTAIRVSTWLRTPGLPEFVAIYEVTMVRILASGEPEVLHFRELQVPLSQIIAMHLVPPADEKPEFDPSEINRKLEPVSAIALPFRFDGVMRMPAHLTLSKQMAIQREPLTTIYDVEVAPVIEPIGAMKSSIVMLRSPAFMFASRTTA